ncbi:AfsR/SARP family transcriptional regulator [Crossiella cryophila]|uniref:DNA-binding SARP family transcriptional activator n=1 Tax=Crossiella cryophila TaxID=43355 RepID=A0A7W7CGX3_9PSEU|nr:bacterial transcriptional activator domain-containing protein [Crossiella cryophila]MBB4679591.1 DNA-binding SARP family transcriptional activator [Crossiella cryophila]
MVDFALLGVIEMYSGNRGIHLGHAKQRVVLAALLAESGRPVPLPVLEDRLWGRRRPPSSRATLYSYLSRLRAILDRTGGAAIERTTDGYLLATPEHALDLHRFQDLLRRARVEPDPDLATALFEQALALWRGEFCAGVDLPWFNNLRDTLHAQRLIAELDHADLALGQGRHSELLPALTSRATAHPLDERAAAQLMTALWQSGRAAEALAHFEVVRTRLVTELGVDPGMPLRQLHCRILRGLAPGPGERVGWGWRGRPVHTGPRPSAGAQSRLK